MARLGRGGIVLATAALLAPTLALVALADHGCPAYEKLRYDFTTPVNLDGDLYALEHWAGYVVFRECMEVRQRATLEEVRFEARGGAYTVHVSGEDFDDTTLLVGASNVTKWYAMRDIRELTYAGVSREGEVAAPVPLPFAPDDAAPARLRLGRT